MSLKSLSSQITGFKPRPRHFFQPLAIAVVCLVFIVLLLVMGNMQLKSMDQGLMVIMRSRGQLMIQTVQNEIRNYYGQFMWNPDVSRNPVPDIYSEQYSFKREESFLFELLNLARQIDFRIKDETFSEQQLEALSREENLELIGWLDQQGNVILSNRPVDPPILQFAAPVLRGKREFRTNLFTPHVHPARHLLIAFRRRVDSGILIMGLSHSNFQARQIRFAVQQVLKTIDWDADVAYFVIRDRRGHVIEGGGHQLEWRRENPVSPPPLERTSQIIRIRQNNRHIFEITTPLYIEDIFHGSVRLGLVMDEADHMLQENRRHTILSILLMIFIAVLSMLLLHVNQKRFIVRLQAMEKRMHQAEKLSSLGRLAAGVAHEIRNPLNAISMGVQKIQRDTDHPLIRVIRDEIERLNLIIEEFLTLSRSRRLQLQPCNLQMLLEPVIELIKEDATLKGIRIIAQWPAKTFPVTVDKDKIKQAFFNILKNAIESISGEGRIDVMLDAVSSRQARLRIMDSGSGLTPAEIDHIFDPDYTTKEQGIGLGLPLAHEIIQAHGGQIKIKSEPGRGSIFDILLPIEH
jgi:signal transduction histidine kinase